MSELTPYTPEITERSEENSCGTDSFAKPRQGRAILVYNIFEYLTSINFGLGEHVRGSLNQVWTHIPRVPRIWGKNTGNPKFLIFIYLLKNFFINADIRGSSFPCKGPSGNTSSSFCFPFGETSPDPLPPPFCFPQVKPQVSNYPLTPPSIFHKLFLRLFEKRDKF